LGLSRGGGDVVSGLTKMLDDIDAEEDEDDNEEGEELREGGAEVLRLLDE